MSNPLTFPIGTRRVQEEIPHSKLLRNKLLRLTRDYIQRIKPVPPLPADELQHHCQTIIKTHNLPAIYYKFLAVLINNELWREQMAAVPFNRRLLLLPQCLRHEVHCESTPDPLGMICEKCGHCSIYDLQTEAERLGYVVMVTEGSPVVMAMLESGQVEAVVGVSCLSVLEKVFPYMDAAAIPGIAIPLLRDGCEKTLVDLDWVWDAIHLRADQQSPSLNLGELREHVEQWFEPKRLAELMGPSACETEKIGQEWLTKSGKRWRPFLASCVYYALQGRKDEKLPESLAKLAVAVECFHKASLIHDDIEDHDTLRYGEETLHQTYGVEIALNVGDFLLGEGYRLIGECECRGDQTARMLRSAALGHRNLSLGQGEELCWQKNPRQLTPWQTLEIFRYKTAPAFGVALTLAAILAGGDEQLCRTLEKYSDALGTAYQIYDDLDDFSPNKPENDLASRRPSLIAALALEAAPKSEKAQLARIWLESEIISAETMAKITTVIDRYRVVDKAEELLEFYKNQAIRSLSELHNSNLKSLLRRVLGKIFNDLESLVCCYEYKTEHDPEDKIGRPAAG